MSTRYSWYLRGTGGTQEDRARNALAEIKADVAALPVVIDPFTGTKFLARYVEPSTEVLRTPEVTEVLGIADPWWNHGMITEAVAA